MMTMRLVYFVLGSRAQPVRYLSTVTAKLEPSQYCMDLVQKQDYEHYLTNLLIPATARRAAFAARAFSCEVAGVRDSVTDRTIGLMRVQFWKDAISAIYEGRSVPQHPVVMELAGLVATHQPNQQLLQNLAGSRDHFLSDRPFHSLEEVEEYGEKAFSSVYLLLLEVMGNSSGHAKHAATQ